MPDKRVQLVLARNSLKDVVVDAVLAHPVPIIRLSVC